ncbi:S-type pyocin domain-containing protein [Pseudomonas cedrina subsp. fulgida]|nr:S-type pyocin domain-containing protein [Pseudomonas cedrina subsp. fulgida]
MAQQGWRPGQPLEIKPTIITAGRRNTYWGGEGGGYVGTGDGWGLQEGPRRGEGDRSRFRNFDFPSTTADFIGEQKYNQSLIDAEYSVRFAMLHTETEREFEETLKTAKTGLQLNEIESAITEQKTALEIISAKKVKYANTAPAMYGLYDQIPFFLMENLTYTKLRETLASADATIELKDTYTLYDIVWRAAQEVKALSLSIEILAKKLTDLANARQQLEVSTTNITPAWAHLHNEYLKTIAEELEIHVQLLPEFLQGELAALAGSVDGLSAEQALMLYKSTLDKMIEQTMAAIRPVDPPLARNHNGLIFYYSATNPLVTPPLSKPELEGLKQLIYLQQNTTLGMRWLSHHDSVLKSESVRYLVSASNAISDLAERAQWVAAEQSRINSIRVAHTYRLSGPASVTQALVTTSAGAIATAEASTVTLNAAIRAALVTLSEFAASTASGFFVGVSALVYSPKLADGELPERYALSTPVSTLAPDLSEATITSATSGTVDLPARLSSKTVTDGQSEVFVVHADGTSVPSKVKVITATYDPIQNAYTVITDDVPSRTLTWTPIVAPGNSSTTLPVHQFEPPVYVGATITPMVGRIDSFPGISEASFDDFITVFPIDSGLPPIYVMLRDKRENPGVVTGMGQPVAGNWLGAAEEQGAPIPSQIADQLRGRTFTNFKEFREVFWQSVAADPALSAQFILVNRERMSTGRAAKTRKAGRVGKRSTFEIHHMIEISKGGDVYNLENLRVLTPKRHIELHKKGAE